MFADSKQTCSSASFAVRFSLIITLSFLCSACAPLGRCFSSGPQVPELVRLQAPVQVAEVRMGRPAFAPVQAVALDVTNSRLPSPLLGMTPEVKIELDKFLTSDRGSIERILERKAEHGDMIEAVFEEEGVPFELANLAGIESHFNPAALSPAGARGMWQLMQGTAKIYGLQVNRGRDERVDPVLSTKAAAKLLRDLYEMYRDWHLALAAYNAGQGRIGKAVSQAGSSNYWTICRAGILSRETERFVPKFIALSIIMKEPERFGFDSGTMFG